MKDYFSAHELRCRCGCGVGKDDMDPDFLAKLNRWRHAVNKRMDPTCGARCPPHNEAVGGGKRSQHLAIKRKKKAHAVDIEWSDEFEVKILAQEAAKEGLVLCFYRERNFIHVDDYTSRKCSLYRCDSSTGGKWKPTIVT